MLVLDSVTTELYTTAQSAQNEFSQLPSCELIQVAPICYMVVEKLVKSRYGLNIKSS